MTLLDHTRPGYTPLAGNVQSGMAAAEADDQILRIQRIGKRLFQVANCLVVLGDGSPVVFDESASNIAQEIDFCAGMHLPDEITVIPDTRIDARTSQHAQVTGAPHIGFFVTCPILNNERRTIGSINLIDYGPHTFDGEDEKLLADLARLVERELHLRSMSVTQLALQKKNKNLRRRSLIDPLIGTWNRGAIMRILSIEAIRCDKLGVPLSLVVIDLDFFKNINDTYGHPAGDTVLVKVASRMRSCIRPQEALGRYGGEEFIVVLPGASQDTAMAIAERMRIAVAAHPENIGDKTVHLTISAGVASSEIFPQASVEEMISRADVALYRAKDSGRNKVMCAIPA